MCRMVIFKGNSAFSMRLVKSLKKAAEGDFFNNLKPHKDGWGGIIITEEKETFVRSIRPIFIESPESLMEAPYSIGLLHARLSAPNEPLNGPIDSHPFIIHGDDEIVYIAHNGWINKKEIGEKFGIPYANKNDTEVFARMIEKMEGHIIERLQKGIEYTSSYALLGALNLMCLITGYNNEKNICYYSDFKGESIYLRLFRYEENENFAVMSSTVAYEMGLIDEHGKILNSGTEEVPQRILFLNGKKL